MKRSLLCLRGGTIVGPDGVVESDVLIDGEKIAQVAPSIDLPDAESVDVSGKLVLPGGVDVHTHLDTPFMGTVTSDDYPTGTAAAAAGGTTTIIDFAFQASGQALPNGVATWHEKASRGAAIDYGFHLAVTDPYDGFLADMRTVIDDGVPSFKVFMAYKGAVMVDDGTMFQMLQQVGDHHGLLCVHAENGDVIDVLANELARRGRMGPSSHALSRPAATEWEAVRRAIALAEMAEAPLYLVHLSTDRAVDAVREGQANGVRVSAETCTHYLLLGPEEYHRAAFEGAKYVVTPPLREEHHREALWRGLVDGGLGIVSSDHCPFCFQGQKTLGRDDFRLIPNGGPGVEQRMILLYAQGVRSGRLDLERFVEVAATGPARTFGLYPRKGVLAPGSDADICVLDPDQHTLVQASTQVQNVDYTPYDGWRLPGRITHVYSRGELVGENGRHVGSQAHGQFVARRLH